MSLRHAVLGLLTAGPASGYDLMKRFESSLAYVWSATQSQLYGELTKMADEGLVEVAAEGPRGRKEYAVTDDGRAALLHWMTEVEPEPLRRNGLLLRAFFLHLVEPDKAVAFLRHQADLAAQQNEELSKLADLIAEEEPCPENTSGRIVLEYGLRASATYRDWAGWAEKQLDASGPRNPA
ncbi:PadR family transcriptional regulator [Kibdelosporangium aridum]|uniref:PadR family transcriptional regulator n=1 Tax=Kibdelosporangium aridum TaxID=2030 RepID=A0A428XYH9_KIBAR|nr:PadR family transcriptional regulator [Kibdelosporangium aridum]RSM60274.1 PadR family transcriptional regulator [Kibdelosporangium aridum]